MYTAYYTGYAPAARVSRRSWRVSLLLFPACALYLLNPDVHTPLDTLSMLLFDGGRSAFEPLGGLWVNAGGVLAQIVLPAALALGCLAFQQLVGVQLFLFWLGQNLVNASMNLATREWLHSHAIGHGDWQALLGTWGLAGAGPHVGAVIFAMGSLCFVLALAMPHYAER